MADKDIKVKVWLIKGPMGLSICLDQHRVCGPKPWGGGEMVQEWTIPLKELEYVVRNAKEDVAEQSENN